MRPFSCWAATVTWSYTVVFADGLALIAGV